MRIVTLLAFGLVPAATLAQQSAEPPATPDHVRREIMAVEERIGQANFECDAPKTSRGKRTAGRRRGATSSTTCAS